MAVSRSLLVLLLVPALATAGGRVSHFKAESKLGANYYNVQSAIDGRVDTAWMVPGESDNKGEWIEIDIPKGDVDRIGVYPGYGKSPETFKDYPRVKQLRVDIFAIDDDQALSQVGSATIDIEDKAEFQIIDIPDVKAGQSLFGGKVKMTVLDVHAGDDYPNLAIAELVVVMKEFDAVPKIAGVSAEAEGHGRDLLLDTNPKTFWAADPKEASITLASTGYGMSSLGFVPAGKDYARPKTVKITVGTAIRTTELPDALTEQWVPVPAFNGYTGGGFGDVVVEILEVWPGTQPLLGVAELKARATTYEPS